MKSILTFLLCSTFAVAYSQTDTLVSKVYTPVNIDSVYEKPEVEAQFPGGEKKWNKYVQEMVQKNIDALVNDLQSRGTCSMNFIVDANGVVSALRVMTLDGSVLAKFASAAILNGPKWVPATINGIKVKSIRNMKITFKTN
jgi:protein TonB